MARTGDAGEKLFGGLETVAVGPEVGEIILEPEHAGAGHWVGAPSAFYDSAERCWWLTYRRRRPYGVDPDGRGDRGYRACVARSEDGVHCEDVWCVEKSAWHAASMERFSLVRDGNMFRLYVSYADPTDSRWRIAMLEAQHPSRFDAGELHPVLAAKDLPLMNGEKVEGVKDPWVFRIGDAWQMLISCAGLPAGKVADRQHPHGTGDVYATGLVTAPTALATSRDGRHWEWQGRILTTGEEGAWDHYQSRLNSLVPLGGVWLGFYDGSASHKENCEERCGVATCVDLRHWTKLTPERPAAEASGASHSLRYVEGVLHEGALHCYYEYARPDGSHDLRRLIFAVDSSG